MNCRSCSRRTLSLFIQSFTNVEIPSSTRATAFRNLQTSRFHSASPRFEEAPLTTRPSRRSQNPSTPNSKPPTWQTKSRNQPTPEPEPTAPKRKQEPWQIHKAALKEKLHGESWNPRKKLSPDTMEGIRHLHQSHPDRFTTAVLADHFKVSAEAVRRILKSKWRPSDEEQEERMRRWDKRGERIWTNLVELGVKPPKKWREMGVGRASGGDVPMWKSRSRNRVPVNESVNGDNERLDEDVIPTVDGKGDWERRSSQWHGAPLTDRL